jgi:hypothetical protein
MSEPSEALWYIHLQRDQYKTGRYYGEWCGAIPNIEFSDGKTFYQYLERWFYRGYEDEDGNWHGYVKVLPKLNHDFAFTSSRSGKPLDQSSFSGYVQRIFWRLVGVRVRPHSLRHMLCTFLKDVQANDAEKESISLWMKHSREMQNKHYSHQEQARALQPALDFMIRSNSEILKNLKDGNNASLNDLTQFSQPDKIGAAAPRYGQQLVGEKVVDHPEEQKIIELIRRHRKSGKTLEKIAAWLNEQGYQTRHGCMWQKGQIKRIVDRLNSSKC